MSNLEWNFFLTGGLSFEAATLNPFAWLSDKSWAEITKYCEMKNNSQLLDHIQKNVIKLLFINVLASDPYFL